MHDDRRLAMKLETMTMADVLFKKSGLAQTEEIRSYSKEEIYCMTACIHEKIMNLIV
jgi:hypothetical protein